MEVTWDQKEDFRNHGNRGISRKKTPRQANAHGAIVAGSLSFSVFKAKPFNPCLNRNPGRNLLPNRNRRRNRNLSPGSQLFLTPPTVAQKSSARF